MNLFNKARGKFVADVDEIRPQFQESNLAEGAAVFSSSLVRSVGPSIGATIDQLDALTLTEVGSLNELATPWYADQVLPFDITLAGANEYGAMTAADQVSSSFRQQRSSRARAAIGFDRGRCSHLPGRWHNRSTRAPDPKPGAGPDLLFRK